MTQRTPYNPIFFQLSQNVNHGFSQHIHDMSVEHGFNYNDQQNININWFDDVARKSIDENYQSENRHHEPFSNSNIKRKVLQLPEETQVSSNFGSTPTRCGDRILGRRREISDDNTNNSSVNYRHPGIWTKQ